jgi:hypothetical protein
LLMRSMMMELSLSKITSWRPRSMARSTALYTPHKLPRASDHCFPASPK